MEASQSAALISSQIFHNYAVGIGVLLTGLGGLKILYEWAISYRDKNKRKRLSEELKAKYPPGENGKSFQLIESSSERGKIYLHDRKTDKKHHIASILTLIDLGYDHSMVQGIDKDVFDSIDTGDEFLTQGERYS